MTTLDFDRIQHLYDVSGIRGRKVTVVGVGSGGAPVCDHLTMSGVSRWALYDPDTLQVVNLVKHPRGRADVGDLKVDIQARWIQDRNPSADVQAYAEDVTASSSFIGEVDDSDLVLSCSDQKAVREYVNDVCVEAGTPCVTASVFRTGIGGEVFAYLPGETGCYLCLQQYSMLHDLNLTDDALGLTDEEEARVYGMGEKDFAASGLSIDIQSISLVQARIALAILLRELESSLPPFKANWIVWGNRPSPGIFRHHFEVKQMLLRPQLTCSCSGHASSEDRDDEIS